MSDAVLFLDIATTTGWCEGPVDGAKTSGTMRLAPPGSSAAAVQGGMLAWLGERLTAFRYRAIVYEAPLDPRFMGQKTNLNTARMLLGLCGVVEAVAHQTGHFNLSQVSVHDARHFLVGKRPPKGEGKAMAMRALRMQGFAFTDDNEADAIAGWLYACHLFKRRELTGQTLFSKR